MAERYQSWGRYPDLPQTALPLQWASEPLPLAQSGGRNLLPFGNGRSYGDSCLNQGGLLLDARGLDRFLAFDPTTGLLRCEAGVLLSDILRLVTPRGWFLPVTPGTRYITLGGAIANDVHGKNHHRSGTFGRHLRRFELLRSDGGRLICSPSENADWFRASIGGLGLTGVILWAEIALRAVSNPYIDVETIRYANLDEFFQLSADSDEDFEHTVSWLDCMASGRHTGRGLFMRGNHAAALCRERPAEPRGQVNFPLDIPFSLINKASLKLFNTLYYRKMRQRRQRGISHYQPFFYPLDAIGHWNRIYGRKGFMQYQCVLPFADGSAAVRELLGRIAAAGAGSFLAVMKVFGSASSPGLLSFPRPGVTIALDFPNHGNKTLALLEALDQVTIAAGGAVYPAKDARMSAAAFQQYFPQWTELQPYIDPRFSSSFWRRVTETET